MSAARPSDHPHLLLATDRSDESRQHLAYAARLGNALGARLTLFHALRPAQLVVNAALDASEAPVGEDLGDARDALETMAATLGSNRPVHVDVDGSLPEREAILAAAERHDADIVVLPTHGRTGLRRAVLGSVAEKVLRRSRRPVLLLTDRMLEHEQTPPRRHAALLLATDLSAQARRAHWPAARLANGLGLHLHMLSVMAETAPPPQGGGAPVPRDPADERRRANERLLELREAATHLTTETTPEPFVRVARDPAKAIVEAAEEGDYALLVLSTHGRGGVARLVKGSVAEQVVRHAKTPVLVMPPVA